MKNKKILFVFVTLVLCAGVFLWLTKTQPAKNNTDLLSPFQKEWGKNTVVIGLDDAFPPIGFRDASGKLTGFDVELAEEACRRMGLKPVFQPVVWDTVILSLNKKDIDLIWNGMTITEKREKEISFSQAYLKGENVFLVNAKNNVSVKKDLKNMVVGVQSGSEQEETIKKDPFSTSLKEIKTYDTIQAALLDIKTGRVDAVLADNFSGLYTAKQILKDDVKITVIPGEYGQTQSGVGIRKSDKALRSEVNKVLDDMKNDGSISRLAQKWFGSDELIVR